jgi:cytochrome c553
MNKLAIAAMVMIGAVGTVSAAGNPAAGKEKSITCVACHNADGNSMVPTFPNIAGQHADYIVKQLRDFKSEARKDPTMLPMVAGLSEEDMADLAAFYATQTPAIGVAADKEKAERGRQIFLGGDAAKGLTACVACHGPNGAGMVGAQFPALRGQHTTYTIKALQEFRSGTRTNDANNMMQDVAARMSDSDIAAVAEFIAGLH